MREAIGAEPHLGAMLRHYSDVVLAASHPATNWQETLHATIAIALREGDVTVDEATRRLAMSSRTLQRRLQEIGTSWRHEVESVRYGHAIRLMRDTDLSVRSIAARLGYADARTLRRAIRRWTGRGPDEFRRCALGMGEAGIGASRNQPVRPRAGDLIPRDTFTASHSRERGVTPLPCEGYRNLVEPRTSREAPCSQQ
ncbi:helix-turn-helix domain-containing protein [Nocardia tengchongensis]|uniref:helix-turn-helix domain-containing protein n=1 Tax=Nocardia tengchongensis TaxID=2055889 RepID=UPI00361D3A37